MIRSGLRAEFLEAPESEVKAQPISGSGHLLGRDPNDSPSHPNGNKQQALPPGLREALGAGHNVGYHAWSQGGLKSSGQKLGSYIV